MNGNLEWPPRAWRMSPEEFHALMANHPDFANDTDMPPMSEQDRAWNIARATRIAWRGHVLSAFHAGEIDATTEGLHTRALCVISLELAAQEEERLDAMLRHAKKDNVITSPKVLYAGDRVWCLDNGGYYGTVTLHAHRRARVVRLMTDSPIEFRDTTWTRLYWRNPRDVADVTRRYFAELRRAAVRS